jgi:putative ATPase
MAALARANSDVRGRKEGAVPKRLRSQHPYQRNKLKEGAGYVYPHNDPSGFVAQGYRPEELADRVYYRPSPHGAEGEVAERLRRWWGDERYDDEQWYEFEKFRDPERGA